MRAITFLLLVLIALPSNACMWTYGTTKYGMPHEGRLRSRSAAGALRLAKLRNLNKEGLELIKLSEGATGWTGRNDRAVGFVYCGRYQEAIDLLEKLEKEQPGKYETAANLGTAYELAGNNAKAKRWIEEGIKRNPGSHHGTEWLHVEILKAQAQLLANPDYLQKHSVLNLDYTQLETGAKTITVAARSMNVHEALRALEYQMGERLAFIKGKDPVVASLLFDYAMILAGTETLEEGSKVLRMAAEYGAPPSKVNPLLTKYSRLIFLGKIIWYGTPALLIGLLVWARMHHRNQVAKRKLLAQTPLATANA